MAPIANVRLLVVGDGATPDPVRAATLPEGHAIVAPASEEQA